MTKLFKKSLACVLAVVLCLSAITCGIMASAEGTAAIKLIASTTTPKAGDTVTIRVNAENIDAVAGAEFTVNIGDLTLAEDISDANVAVHEEKEIYFLSENLASVTGGDLFTFDVSVPANAAYGDTFAITFADGSVYADADLADVTVAETGATLTVAASDAEIAAAVKGVTVSGDNATQAVKGTAAYTADEAKALADRINSIGGKITEVGVKVAIGATPDENTADGSAVAIDDAGWAAILAGSATLDPWAAYTGANFDQMEDTVNFVAYVKYTVGDDEIVLKSEVASKAVKDVVTDNVAAAYTAWAAAEDAEAEGTTGTIGDSASFTSTYNLKDMSATANVSMTGAQFKALAEQIALAESKITEIGLKANVNGGSDVKFGAAAIDDTAWEYVLKGRVKYEANVTYSGMNVDQFGDDLNFTIYFLTESGEGDIDATGSVSFIDMIQADESAAAVAYKTAYTAAQ